MQLKHIASPPADYLDSMFTLFVTGVSRNA